MSSTPFDSAATELFISTGNLPRREQIDAAVRAAHARFLPERAGDVSTVYPALEAVNPDLFGIALLGTSGEEWEIGDARHEFTVQSISKPFVFALIAQEVGVESARELIGVNATGRPFNSVVALDESLDGRTNPMVNSGAIATTSLAPGDTSDERWEFIRAGLARFAGRDLALDDATFTSAMETNHRNRGIAQLLRSRNRIYTDPLEAVTLYTRQCCLRVSARDLAVMGATLADGGVNPVTGETVVDATVSRHTLAVMSIAGLYETSGDWLYSIGLPGKSGIGGGIVTVSPGKGGLGLFSPRLDRAGNSVRGQGAARYLSSALGLDLFASSPDDVVRTG